MLEMPTFPLQISLLVRWSVPWEHHLQDASPKYHEI